MITKKIKNSNGFTLIETVIYIALFSLLMTSSFVAVYQIISSTDSLKSKNRTEVEGDFVLRKINWTLSGIDPLSTPSVSGSGCAQSLTIQKSGVINPIRFRLNTVSGINYLEIQDDGVNYYPLTTENASTTCQNFSVTAGNPIGIFSTTTINGKDFVINKYVRN